MGYVLAFDTANEAVVVGIGSVDADGAEAGRIVLKEAPAHLVAGEARAAHRASNTVLIPMIDELMAGENIEQDDIAAIVCGRGPGSFTGVRICMAAAKGIASGLEVPLFGVSTLDAVAWGVWESGYRGAMIVAADAMRKEVYPALFMIDSAGAHRLTSDAVVSARAVQDWIDEALAVALPDATPARSDVLVCGDALAKYRGSFAEAGFPVADDALWAPSPEGLLRARRIGGDAATLLPVYTRLSDAEENERVRLSAPEVRNLASGVQAEGALTFRPLDAAHAPDVASLESRAMGTDAWSEESVLDELPRKDRTWWAAFVGERLGGYCGGLVVDGQVQVLKIAVEDDMRRRGIARHLIGLVASDARDLGATEMTLEVRASNEGAQRFYGALGIERIGVRPGYYSDREDAVIMTGPLPMVARDVAGMSLKIDEISPAGHAGASNGDISETDSAAAASVAETMPISAPLICAFESSCDETAASLIAGDGTILSDVVASQVDFHARFGGVGPEIASRKHIEAICGVADECLERAAAAMGRPSLRWRDLDAIAVTYAPGLVGALVVGVAFAKGLAWGSEVPLVAVNHLEGHLYANKIADPAIAPPMVVSLVSGGHTMLVHVKDWANYETLGSTIDDAVGEAFDKVSKALGLGYPGGPIISRYAVKGNPRAIDFPRALMHSGDLRFSLSGLKTAVITYIHKQQEAGMPLNIPDIAASFQQAVVDVQVAKARTALIETGSRTFCLGGGVAANPALRAAYEKMCAKNGFRLVMPPLSACGDNAAMIAEVALDRFAQGKLADFTLDVKAHAPLDEAY